MEEEKIKSLDEDKRRWWKVYFFDKYKTAWVKRTFIEE